LVDLLKTKLLHKVEMTEYLGTPLYDEMYDYIFIRFISQSNQ